MEREKLQNMLDNKISRYELVIAVAKRAREIIDENALNKNCIEEKAVNLAIQDFRDNKYTIEEVE